MLIYMTDIIYILTNEAMPGLIKIGKTRSELLSRIRALDTTGVPVPFECFYAAEVEDCDRAERLLHDAFDDHRVRKNREFFEIAPERAASALRLAEIREVLLNGKLIADPDDETAIERARERRPRFNFRSADVPVGAILEHRKGAEFKCTVQDARSVEYKGETMSLTSAALKVFHELGYTWSSVSGPESWLFNGETLDERRRRLEEA